MPLDELEIRGWLTRVLERADAASTPAMVAIVGLGLGGSWLTVELTRAPVWRELFYVPIIVAAVRFRLRGAVVAGALSGLLAGPLLPGAAEPLWASLPRTAFYLLVGVTVALVVDFVRSSARHELELERTQRELETQRGALIQAVSHEFRTPLTVIRGIADTFEQHQRHMDPLLRPLVGSLDRASRRLENLVTVVLAAADAMSEDQRALEAVSLTDLFDEVAEMLDGYDAPRRMQVRIGDDARTVVTAGSYLKLIVYTLLENALKFSPPDEQVDITTAREAGSCIIVIRDRGPGISEEELGDAFQPFRQGDERTTRRFGGLGLGLFTAQRLAEGIAADVSLQPHPRRGTVATLVVNEWLHPQLGGQEVIGPAQRTHARSEVT